MIKNLPASIFITTCAVACALSQSYGQPWNAGGSKRVQESLKLVDNAPNEIGEYISRKTLTLGERAERIEFTVTLPLRNLSELKARVANHQRVNFGELDKSYFPRAADYGRIRGWLASRGLKVQDEDPNHMTVRASGTVDQVAAALQTTFARIATRRGEFTSAIKAPVLPSDIADGVLAISGLQPYLQLDAALIPCTNQQTCDNIAAHPPTYHAANGYYLTGKDFRSLYNVPSNLTGSGQTVAIVMWAPVSSSDLASFNSYMGNSYTGSFTEIDVGTKPSAKNDNNGILEAYLDVESVASVAPAANIRLYTTTTAQVADLQNGITQVITDIRNGVNITVLSMSFAGGETEVFTPSTLAAMNQSFITLSALGVTNVAASGDWGTRTPNGTDQALYPASDPFVTSVGGTNLHTHVTESLSLNTNTQLSSGDYIGECVTYTGLGSPVVASGSHISGSFAKPNWQVGSGTFLAGQTYRCYPDIAGPWGFVNHTSSSDTVTNANYNATFGVMFTNIDSSTNSSQFIIKGAGGTSLAAPVWGGLVAMINQNRGASGSIGFLNPWLYEIAENTRWSALKDQSGAYANVVYTSSGWTTYSNSNGTYNEGAGYDLCTGLGTPNFANLASALQSPVAVTQPQSQNVTPGASAVFSAFAEQSPYLLAPATYQWYRNGSSLGGATSAQLIVSGSSTQLSNNGDQYKCVVTLSNNQLANPTITTSTATLTVQNTSTPGRVVNLSSRANALTGNNVLIGGFTIGGSGNMPILSRALGPTLGVLGVSGALSDPTLSIFLGNTQIASNFPWGGSTVLSNAFSTVGAYGLASNSNDSAVLFATGKGSPAYSSLSAGGYSCIIQGNSGDTGVALFEVYDAYAVVGTTWTSSMPYLSNISTRATVGAGDNVLIGGFVVSGSTSKTLLIRATGPTLSAFGLSGVLPDPCITLFDSNGNAVASNQVWNNNSLISSVASIVGAYGWSGSSNDSAIVVTVPAGTYTAIVGGGIGDSGIALLEIFAVP